jgi:hypothetical protein
MKPAAQGVSETASEVSNTIALRSASTRAASCEPSARVMVPTERARSRRELRRKGAMTFAPASDCASPPAVTECSRISAGWPSSVQMYRSIRWDAALPGISKAASVASEDAGLQPDFTPASGKSRYHFALALPDSRAVTRRTGPVA